MREPLIEQEPATARLFLELYHCELSLVIHQDPGGRGEGIDAVGPEAVSWIPGALDEPRAASEVGAVEFTHLPLLSLVASRNPPLPTAPSSS